MKDELIAAQKEYIEYLNENHKAPNSIAHIHGYRISEEDFKKGQKLRNKIQQLENKIK